MSHEPLRVLKLAGPSLRRSGEEGAPKASKGYVPLNVISDKKTKGKGEKEREIKRS